MRPTITCPNCNKHMDIFDFKMNGICPHCTMSRHDLIHMAQSKADRLLFFMILVMLVGGAIIVYALT